MPRALARVLLLLLVPVAAVGPSLLPGRSFAPLAVAAWEPLASEDPAAAERAWSLANRLAADALFPLASDRAVIAERLAHGELPLWEHRQGLGLALLGNTMAAPFYPPGWPRLLLGEPRGAGVHALLALFLAGLGLWLLLERRGLSWGACAVGALALQSGGWGLANLHLAPKVDAALWLPWMLWSAEGALAGRRRAGFALCASTACTFLAGFPPIAVFATCATLAYVATRASAHAASPGTQLRAVMLVLCGLAIASIQLAPTLAASLQSQRGFQDARAIEAQALPPVTALSLVLPELFGTPQSDVDASRDAVTWWLARGSDSARTQQANALEWDLFVGLGALAFAAAALVATPKRALFPGLLALTALAFMQGWPLFALLYHVPGLDLGSPARAASLTWVAFAWLAALGAEALFERRPRALAACAATLSVAALLAVLFLSGFEPKQWAGEIQDRLAARHGVESAAVADQVDLQSAHLAAVRLGRSVLSLVTAALILAAALTLMRRIEGSRSPHWHWFPLALTLCMVGLTRRWAHLVPRMSPSQTSLSAHSAAMDAVACATGDGRLLRLDTSPGGVADVLRLARPNLPQLYDIGDLTPYVVFPPRRPVELLAALDPDSRYRNGSSRLSDARHVGHPILDLLRVTALLSREPVVHPRLEEVFAREDFHVYRRTGVPELARVVPAAVETTSDEIALGLLASRAVDPLQATVLAPGSAVGPTPELPAPWTPGDLSVSRPLPEVLEVAVRASSGGWLVVAEAWDPGWEAELDGREVAIARADHALRAVRLPPGDHAVRFVYRPRAWRLGWSAALAGLAAALLLLARRPRVPQTLG